MIIHIMKQGCQLHKRHVRSLERGDAPLEESLKLFEEGTGLVRACGSLLDQAELQVKKVMVGPGGAPVEGEFTDEE